MPVATINGVPIAYELIGDHGPTWVVTPGGRFSKDIPGVRETATALATEGNRALIWDRPNCGESGVCFEGATESSMQADHLAGLLVHLDLAPAMLAGGSAGARVSMLTAAAHPDVVRGLALWWISGGVYGLMTLGTYYCGGTIKAAWTGGMEAVVAMDQWREVLERNPANRDRFLRQDPAAFIATFERWMAAYCPRDDEVVPGLTNDAARRLTTPTVVVRSGTKDPNHTRAVSEQTAALLPNATLIDSPWPDDGSMEHQADQIGFSGLFRRWPELVPSIKQWASAALR